MVKIIRNKKEILRAASFVLGKKVNNINELSDEQLLFFTSLPKTSLCKVFCVQEVANGLSYSQVANKYGISKTSVKRFFDDIG